MFVILVRAVAPVWEIAHKRNSIPRLRARTPRIWSAYDMAAAILELKFAADTADAAVWAEAQPDPAAGRRAPAFFGPASVLALWLDVVLLKA